MTGGQGRLRPPNRSASLGELLRSLRERALLTQEELADRAQVSVGTVRGLESGRILQPRSSSVRQLARALGLGEAERQELAAAARGAPASGGAADYDVAEPGQAPPVPAQLPADVAGFTGRAQELARLTSLLHDGRVPATLVITAIAGTAGVGKTALALHWAHLVGGRFGDGQLYVNLRGFDPVAAPVPPAEALRGLLDALAVPPERIPQDLEARAGLFRSLLAGRKMLIVLDNARDEQQVRPLLPASPGSLVIVTSRNQLTGLAVADGARLLTLDVLTHDEATALLTARTGATRAAAEPQAVAEIVSLCACLPLALAVAAARAQARPGFPLAALAAELRDAASRLDALDTGDPAASVRAVFSWSYQQLGTAPARMFRLLGLHPGPDISVPAAASLAATDEPGARRLLGELARAHLIAEHVPGRYGFHDLLRAYAAAQAREHDSDSDREAAIARMLSHYLHSADAAAWQLEETRAPVSIAPPEPGTVPERIDGLARALAWFQAEYPVLAAALALADSAGFGLHAWQLAWNMVSFLALHGDFREVEAIQRTAMAAATRIGDLAGQATCGRMLAGTYSRLGDYDRALAHFAASLVLYQRLGDRMGEAKILHGLGTVAYNQGRYDEALDYREQCLRLYRAIGFKGGEARMLNNVGMLHTLLGDYQRAQAVSRQALALCQEAGYRGIEPYAWDTLGFAEHHLGNFGEAAACYQRSLDIFREFGDRPSEADILTHLGDTHQATGDLPGAREAWRQALAILEDLQHPDADQVRAKLDSLNGLPWRLGH